MVKEIPTNKDYWPEVLKLTDERGEINSPDAKPLEEYLRIKLNLSKPTVLSLLNKWESEGKIYVKREGFLKKATGLIVLSPGLKALGQTILLIDWDNIFHNLYPSQKENLTSNFVSQGFLKLVKQISREVGKIVSVFVFAPPHLISLWEKTFYEQGFFIINCPKITNKKKKEQDTVDEVLMDLARKLINSINLTHLCVATGDKDFVSLYQDAILQGLKIVTIPASEKSLAQELIELSDKIIVFPSNEAKAG